MVDFTHSNQKCSERWYKLYFWICSNKNKKLRKVNNFQIWDAFRFLFSKGPKTTAGGGALEGLLYLCVPEVPGRPGRSREFPGPGPHPLLRWTPNHQIKSSVQGRIHKSGLGEGGK